MMNIKERAEKRTATKRTRKEKKVVESKSQNQTYLLKPTIIPEGFILKVDTREQDPLFNPIPKGLCVVRDKVEVGDYSIKGMEQYVCAERKKMSDFYSFIGSERSRTVEKLKKMKEMYFACLIIEEEEDDIYYPMIPTKVSPEVARAFLVFARVDCNVHVITSSDRGYNERFLLDHFVRAYKKLREIGEGE